LLGVALLVGACTSGESAGRPAADARSTTEPATEAEPASDLPVIAPFGRGGAEFTAADGTVRCSCVLVADTAEERSQGLMNVTDLQGYAGMVFVFAEDVESRFTMRDTPMPLTIGWFSADGSLVSTADMDPCLGGGECPAYPAAGPYRFALEVPQGELGDVGATDGTTFRLVDECEDRLSR
jgi:uncharacterized membrane protein (UPF0127 family)